MTIPAPSPLIVQDASGAFTVDASLVAQHLGWRQEELRDMMRRGLVASRVERGEGEDLGRWRLTVRCGNRRWRAIVEADGTVSEQQVEFVTLRGGATDGANKT